MSGRPTGSIRSGSAVRVVIPESTKAPVPGGVQEEGEPASSAPSMAISLSDTETTKPSPETPSSSTGIISSAHFPQLSPDATDRVFPIRSVIMTPKNESPPPLQHGEDPFFSPGGDSLKSYSIIDAATWGQVIPTPAEDATPAEVQNVTAASLLTNDTLMQTGANDVKADRLSSSSKTGAHTAVEDVSSGRTSNDGLSINSSTDGGVPLDNSDRSRSGGSNDISPGPKTRFRHVITEGGHVMVTGADPSDLQYCEEEPIHIPAAVQGFGVLIALHEESEGKLVVRIVSENSKRIMGYSPKELFELDSFCDILTEEQEDNLLDHVDFVRDEACDPKLHGPEVFIISIRMPDGESRKFWCAMHVNSANPDFIICEFELEDDHINPLNVGGQTTPEEPTDTLGMEPTPEQLAQSTINVSRPLRVLRNARRKRGEAAAMKVFNIMSQVQEQLSSAQTLDALLNVVAGIVKELTGFHRVMVYQFDSNWNGMVVAELVDPRATKDLFKGLHFPASDIPKQGRDLYKVNRVRLLYDRDQEAARLVYRTMKDLETPLDMTYSYLREISPIHLKYLANMAVRSSMSISINAFNELWGLIICHSYGSSGMRVSFPIRKMCRLIGDTTSRNIERLSYASRLQARKLINTVPTEKNPSGYIIASSDDLLKLFEADYGALSIRDETKILGKLDHSQEVLALLEYLRMKQINAVLSSHDVSNDFPDLNYPPGFKHIAGLLYVPLSAGGRDFIVFFRRGQLTEIKWAGNPYERESKKGTPGYLEPRTSFKTWKETIMSRSREWSEADVETAAVLCLVYGKFIEVWRQKEAAMQSSQLTKLLLANSAHEVRTPLNAIINYLEIALEGSLDQETRENLAKSHSASKSLIYVINDLLDLTNTENGQNLIKDEAFDLPATLREATDMFQGEANRKNIAYNVLQYPGIPESVLGDQRCVRQVITNVIANAIQHTSSGAVTVEFWPSAVQPEPGHVDVEIAVHDTGSGMSQSTVEALFRELEQVSGEDDNVYYEQYDKREGGQRRVLGLGLALVARIVRNMNGQLSVKSEEGKGSRFKIQLRFPLPEDKRNDAEYPAAEKSSLPDDSAAASNNSAETEGEVLLVDRSMHRRSDSMQWPSSDSERSGSSRNSSRSTRSDVDRLISAIQEPPLVQKSTGESATKQYSDSEANRLPKSDVRPSLLSPLSLNERCKSPLPSPTSSIRTPMPLASPPPPGQEIVTDSGVPLSALRVPQEDVQGSSSPQDKEDTDANDDSKSEEKPQSASQEQEESSEAKDPAPNASSPREASPSGSSLRVLVAEDDPVNSKILQKRLEKFGHTVHLTVNGEECAIAHRKHSNSFDAVLMDLQVSSRSLSLSLANFPDLDDETMNTDGLSDANRRRRQLRPDDPRIRGHRAPGADPVRQGALQRPHPHLRRLRVHYGEGSAEVHRFRVRRVGPQADRL